MRAFIPVCVEFFLGLGAVLVASSACTRFPGLLATPFLLRHFSAHGSCVTKAFTNHPLRPRTHSIQGLPSQLILTHFVCVCDAGDLTRGPHTCSTTEHAPGTWVVLMLFYHQLTSSDLHKRSGLLVAVYIAPRAVFVMYWESSQESWMSILRIWQEK